MTGWRNAACISGALLIAGLGAFPALPAAAQSNDDVSDLRGRVEHIERDLRDLQQEVYRSGQGLPRSNEGPPPAGAAPYSQRINDIEASLRQLTGQLEELSHRVNDLSQKMDRMQNEMNYQANQSAQPGDDQGNAAPQLAPGPSNLGTVPQGAVNNVPQPKPAPPSNDRIQLKPPASTATGPVNASGTGGPAPAKFNAAMDLLARGSYDQARSSFRSIADQYPTHQLAPEALYWTGDISYSAKKDYGEAARSFAELLKKYPKAPHAPEAMLKLGQSLLGLGQKQEGCATLAAFPAKYPTAGKPLLAKAKSDAKKAGCK